MRPCAADIFAKIRQLNLRRGSLGHTRAPFPPLAARARRSADQALNEKATARARIESQAAELARVREQEEKSAIATARARAQAEARAETAERIRAQADQCATALADEHARAEALALEAERRKI